MKRGVCLKSEGISWLASYPKSGNTWVRVFLENVMSNQDVPASINGLSTRYGINRRTFDHLTGVDSAHLLVEEVNTLWVDVATKFSAASKHPTILKTHASYKPKEQNPFLVNEAARCAIYLLRNPLDVCPSFAKHLGRNIDETIELMRDEGYLRCQSYRRWRVEMGECVSSWSMNAETWIANRDYPVLIVRYEDLRGNPALWFKKIVEFLGVAVTEKALARAIDFSCLERLQEQEAREGFREKGSQSDRFFGTGIVGGWRNELSRAQAQQIVKNHGEVMERLGYSTCLT